MKEYKTNEELINYLENKNLKIIDKNNALNLLKKYSYYSIINTYKDLFKDNNNLYKDESTFEDIYSLYDFDKNIRAIFLKYILEIETVLKSLLAEVISYRYGIKDYLNINNYDTNLPKQVLNESIGKINDEISKQNGKHEAVTHYITKYGYLPPFVLTKILTFGELSRYYSILTQSDKQCISKEFKLSDKVLKQIIQNMTMVRNICAHNDRLFSFHSKFLISFKYIDSKYNSKDKSVNLYIIKESMKYMLDDNKKLEFENEIKEQIDKLKDNVNSVEIKIILNLMGYPNE